MKSKVLKGSIFVALGATSYGMLGTFVKMAYHDGFSTAEVTLSQFSLGFVGLLILTLFGKPEPETKTKNSDIKSVLRLIIAGTSLGLTSIFYYLAVQYIPVSVAIVLLMQAVWMGLIVEAVMRKKIPGIRRIVSVLIILAGTVLATSLFKQSLKISWTGFGWAMLAALAYTATMYSSNHLELHFRPLKRSLYMILGGLIIIVLVFHSAFSVDFSYRIFLSWGLLLSLFGTIVPPLLFNRGMPLIGVGLGAIIAAIEIPVSVFMEYLLLNEPVSFLQWMGILLILFAVGLMNTVKGRGGVSGQAMHKK